MLKNQIMKHKTYKMYEGEDEVHVERDDVLKILEQQPCEDCVSRQAVVGYLCTHCPDDAECFEDCDDIKNIKALPSVTPSYNSIKTELKPCEDVLDEIITQIEQMRDKDKIAEYPYKRCIRIDEGYKKGGG